MQNRTFLSAYRLLPALKNPENFFIREQAMYGDPFCVWMPGRGQLYVTGHPDGARDIFLADRETFQEFKSTILMPLLGDHSLLVIAGEQHRREKKLMMPPFHGTPLLNYAKIIQRVTLERIEQWKASGNFLAKPEMRAITLEVIIRVVFGIRDSAYHGAWRQAMNGFLDGYTPLLTVFPMFRNRFYPPWNRFVSSRAHLDQMIREEIAKRDQPGQEPSDDVMAMMLQACDEAGLGLTSEEVKDELRTLLVGGHETATAALSWAMHFIHADPSILAKLMKEIVALGPEPSSEALLELPYLEAVCSEALRIHPIVPVVIRHLKKDLHVRGYRVPAGKHVAVSLVLLHRHPEVWQHPERFDPDRFVGRKYASNEYAPFGGGFRRCLGGAFAPFEMAVILGTLLSRLKLELDGPRELSPMLNNISMGPKGNVPMRVLPN